MSEGKQLIPDAAVKAIQDSVRTEIIEVDGHQYVTRVVYDPPLAPRVETLIVATLGGLVEFVQTQRDMLPAEAELVLHVENDHSVAVLGPISTDRSRARDVYARAVAVNPLKGARFEFGRYYDLEDLLIYLKTLFEGSDALLAMLGNVQGSKVVNGADDGFSQEVTVRRNVVRVGTEKVENPVTLRPFRTFSEVDQPESKFILRLKGDPDNEDPPSIALFECDGGAWQVDAVETIKQHLAAELPEEVVIG